MLCKISGKMKLATTIFVVAFDMQETKKSPARGGASNYSCVLATHSSHGGSALISFVTSSREAPSSSST